jgi:2',3'-cyclic-nucleotide 2'-phosphodiesterase (5'-nucleotidase family)
VTGHYHEARDTPFVVPETGALIVQAGSFAGWVGRLEIELDPATQKIIRYDGRLVAMRHDSIAADREMLAWVQEREQALAPEAREFVLTNPAELDRFAVARLAAEGLRRAGAADIGFCHPYQVVLNGLPAGPVNVNTVFQTGGHFGSEIVRMELTGAQVEAYVNALVTIKREPPEWSGFRISRRQAPAGGEIWQSNLEPTRRYAVVMPRFEWETRYLPLAAKSRTRVTANPVALSFTEATVAYFRQVVAAGGTLQRHATELAGLRED